MPPGKFLKYWFPVLLWMGLIFWMSTGMFSWKKSFQFLEPILRSIMPTISHYSIVMINNALRKSGHVVEYFVSGILVYRAFKAGSNEPRFLTWGFRSVLFVTLLALSDEFHQSFVASRTSSFIDVGIDTAGGVVAIGVSMLRQFRKGR
jgi:VanZ family protein